MQVIKYTNIEYILDRFKQDYPFIEDKYIDESTVVEWIGQFLLKLPKVNYLINKVTDCNSELDPNIVIENYKGTLPCDLIELYQLRHVESHEVLDVATDLYINHKDPHNRENTFWYYDKYERFHNTNRSFMIQDNVIHTNFEEGTLEASYLAMPLDEKGLPKIPDVEVIIDAVVKHIAGKLGRKLYFMDLMRGDKMQMLVQEASDSKVKAISTLKMPNAREMENFVNFNNSLIRSVYHKDFSFRGWGKYRK